MRGLRYMFKVFLVCFSVRFSGCCHYSSPHYSGLLWCHWGTNWPLASFSRSYSRKSCASASTSCWSKYKVLRDWYQCNSKSPPPPPPPTGKDFLGKSPLKGNFHGKHAPSQEGCGVCGAHCRLTQYDTNYRYWMMKSFISFKNGYTGTS